ncbi:MAG: molybdopterin-guanine dinucleotide biosynthesis protein B [Epsilonproteobacteria bacterium]|nr:molybdopterin-guanine dinucleotide biosynthesis protein B [Campylobacterota bacterium]
MRRYAVAFTGPSNSGKTTLIEKIAKRLIDRDNRRVAIIKHDPKDKAIFDREGKDSFKFFNTGAEVIVTSPERTTYLSNRAKELDELIELFGEFDVLLVEGLKSIPLPRVAIFRGGVDESYMSCSSAVAIDDTIDRDMIPEGIDVLNLNDVDMVIEWIEQNGEEI